MAEWPITRPRTSGAGVRSSCRIAARAMPTIGAASQRRRAVEASLPGGRCARRRTPRPWRAACVGQLHPGTSGKTRPWLACPAAGRGPGLCLRARPPARTIYGDAQPSWRQRLCRTGVSSRDRRSIRSSVMPPSVWRVGEVVHEGAKTAVGCHLHRASGHAGAGRAVSATELLCRTFRVLQQGPRTLRQRCQDLLDVAPGVGGGALVGDGELRWLHPPGERTVRRPARRE